MSRRLARFIDIIEHFDPQIIYRPGRSQQAADALSRIPGFPPNSDDSIEDNLAVEEEMPELVDDESPQSETFFEAVKSYLDGGNVDDEKLESEVAKEADHYVVRGGKLWRLLGDGNRVPVVYKESEVAKTIEGIHQDLGYYGGDTTITELKK
jgi:hypothetical protein